MVEYGLQVPVPCCFQWRKATIGWLHRVTWKKRYRVRLKSIVLLQNLKMKSKRTIVALKYKKNALLRKLTKIFSFILCFSELVKLFTKAGDTDETGDVFYLRTEKSFPLKQCPLYLWIALEMYEREVYRKQTISHVSVFLNKVSAVEHDRFMQASLCTVALLFANTLP